MVEQLLYLTDETGAAIIARLVRMELGERACDESGQRCDEYLSDAVQFYATDRESLDPLGFPIGLCCLDLLDAHQLKNGKFRLSWPRRRRGIRAQWLAADEAQRLLGWINAYLHSYDLDAQAQVQLQSTPRARLSALAERQIWPMKTSAEPVKA